MGFLGIHYRNLSLLQRQYVSCRLGSGYCYTQLIGDSGAEACTDRMKTVMLLLQLRGALQDCTTGEIC